MGERLTGKVIVVSGGGSGIGRAFCLAFAEEGARVGVLDRSEAQAQETAAEIQAAGGEAIAVVADVADRAQVRAALAEVVDRFGQLNVIFNNAGITLSKDFLATTEDDMRRLHDVNVLGVLIGTQEAAEIFRRQGGGGKVVNTCSVAGRQASAMFAAYAASKFAVNGLTQAAARALAADGIVVTGFAPGIVDTPLWRASLGDSPEDRAAAFEAYSTRIPAGRVSTPNDLVPVGIFLASDDSNYSTGQIVAVDGGMQMV